MGIRCVTHGAQSCALWQPRGLSLFLFLSLFPSLLCLPISFSPPIHTASPGADMEVESYSICSFVTNLKKMIYFNWRIITLQHCDGFLPYVDMNQPWVHMCGPSWIPLPPSSPLHPSRLSQSTGFRRPASCIELALIISFTYGNTDVSVLFSQIIPPLSSPTECKNRFFLCLCFFCCFAYRIVVTVFLNSIYMC